MCELERMAAVHLAATLLGEKTGSMFVMRWAQYRLLQKQVGKLKETLSRHGILLKVFGTPQGALIYAYKPDALRRDLNGEQARAILKNLGYEKDVLSGLQNRLLASRQFPHEIGLFLGYPVEDVAGFMEHQGANCKLIGCWKVYHDVERAQCLFCAYRSCRERMVKCLEGGMSLQEILRVA